MGEMVLVQDLNGIIAENLKQLRKERKLSLDKVAELTGVSKSMLGQIERGETNPTINTIWRIASGLKVSFSSLIHETQADIVIVHKRKVKPLVEADGAYRVYSIFPYDERRRFEIYIVELEEGGCYRNDAQGEKTQEFITVTAGELTLVTNSGEFRVGAGDSITFMADQPHAYHNSGTGLLCLNMVIHYPL